MECKNPTTATPGYPSILAIASASSQLELKILAMINLCKLSVSRAPRNNTNES